MERLAIYVNDAPYAQRFLPPVLARQGDAPCTLVLCPPKLTHRIGKWLSNRQRLQWQRKWADRLQQELQPLLPPALAGRAEWVVSDGRLTDTTERLRRQEATPMQVLDLRLQHVGQNLATVEPGTPAPVDDRWKAPLAVSSSLSVVLALVD